MARFDKTYCSQCGGEFGPGDEGYSHCEDHTKPPHCLPIPASRNQGWPGIYAVLYTDEINGEQTGRDDLWVATTQAIDRAQREAYADGRKDEAEERAWRPGSPPKQQEVAWLHINVFGSDEEGAPDEYEKVILAVYSEEYGWAESGDWKGESISANDDPFAVIAWMPYSIPEAK